MKKAPEHCAPGLNSRSITFVRKTQLNPTPPLYATFDISQGFCMLFEHLIDPAFEVIDDLPAEAIFNAQVETLDWLDDDAAPVTGSPPKPRDSA